MLKCPKPQRLAIIGGSVLAFAVILIVVGILINGQVTTWIEGPGFQDLLNRETAKGLKLKATAFAPLHRVGVFGIQTDSFSGMEGYKTIVTLKANEVSGTFNPLGVALRRWEIDSIHAKSGSVMLQQSEPTPGAPKGAPWPPWWALFWPYRVHLADVKVDDANALWKLGDKGIRHLRHAGRGDAERARFRVRRARRRFSRRP